MFQGWIYEHISKIDRVKNKLYRAEMPRAKKWIAGRGNLELETKRQNLDDLKPIYVIWSLYDDHRAHVPMQPVFLYSGFIQHDGLIHPHLSGRVLRQLAGIQGE